MRRRALEYAAFLAISLLAAGSAAAHAGEIALRDDTFLPYREYSAGQVRLSSYPNLIATELLARVDRKTGAISTLVSLEFAYGGDHLRSYESARNARAETLRFNAISHRRSCEKKDLCVYDEIFTVEIPETELRGAPSDGYQLKVFARGGGDAVVTVPRATIERLLAAVDKQRP
ncbi:MAG TPA: hypothetical protein VJ045_06415 [Hyphomicrobiaceae bacterium]|nr:hypothetical protein [Hyphomicrobiaceae bacterium]